MNTDNSKSFETVVSTTNLDTAKALDTLKGTAETMKKTFNVIDLHELKETLQVLKGKLKLTFRNPTLSGGISVLIRVKLNGIPGEDAVELEYDETDALIKSLSFIKRLNALNAEHDHDNANEGVTIRDFCVLYTSRNDTSDALEELIQMIQNERPSMVYDTLDAFVNVSLGNSQTINELNTVTPRDYGKHFIPVLVGKVGKDSKGYVLIKQSGFYRLIKQNLEEITPAMARYNLKQNKYMIRLLKNTLEVEKPEHVKFEFEEPDLLSNLIRFKVTNLSGEEIGWKYSAQATSRSKLIQLFNQIVFDKITG